MILYDPITHNVFTDEAIFPMGLALGQSGLVDMAPGGADLHARVAGATTLHHEVNGHCAEDGYAWPCRTHRVLTTDLDHHAALRVNAGPP